MKTISYGFQEPEDGDKGSVWFPALASDIRQIADHSHNGVNSAQLSVRAIVTPTVSLPAASWSFVEDGVYRQLMTLPTGIQFDAVIPSCRDSSGHVLGLTIEKASDTTAWVYTWDNTLNVTVVLR